ncbi:unnamed protein product [Linum tenue]|uniref:Uncharacterized protein n=1 Tax=Linum tenue TaxID=586396 RepID=A0AAV0MH64_9ROSI|nr:unnamed protein product [Linum tenue]
MAIDLPPYRIISLFLHLPYFWRDTSLAVLSTILSCIESGFALIDLGIHFQHGSVCISCVVRSIIWQEFRSLFRKRFCLIHCHNCLILY